MTRVLILSATASAINYIRSLSPDPDIELWVADCDTCAGGLYSPYIKAFLFPRARDSKAYRQALLDAIDHLRIDVLVPTSDHDVVAVAQLIADGVEFSCQMFKPSLDAVRCLSDKARLSDHLDRIGLPVPITSSDPDAVPLPAVIKPCREGGGKGVFVVRTAAERRIAIQKCQERYGEYLVQEYIPGGIGSTLMATLLFDTEGVRVADIVMQSSLTFYTWGGGGNAGSVIHDAKAALLARRVVESVPGWRGPVCVEMRRHEVTGELYVMEANCRLNGYSYLSTMNGLNFPRLLVDILMGKRPFYHTAPWTKVKSNFVLGFREKSIDAFVSCGFCGGEEVGTRGIPRTPAVAP